MNSASGKSEIPVIYWYILGRFQQKRPGSGGNGGMNRGDSRWEGGRDAHRGSSREEGVNKDVRNTGGRWINNGTA